MTPNIGDVLLLKALYGIRLELVIIIIYSDNNHTKTKLYKGDDMYLEVRFLPALIPWVASKNRFVRSLAPPEMMRQIWIGQQFFGNFYSTGRCQYVVDNKAALIRRTALDERGKATKRLVRPRKLTVLGDSRMEITWHLPYTEGMDIVKKVANTELIVKWYENRWPEKSPFVFSDLEVRVFPEPEEIA